MRTRPTLRAEHRAVRTACVWTALRMLVCSAAVIAHAAASPLSLHVARLSPALALLSWSVPSTTHWLSLTMNQHSGSPLSLSADTRSSHLIFSDGLDSAAAAFTLCESNDDRSSRSSSSTPLCAHATLHAHSVAATMEHSASSPWDLSGARLHAELTSSPDSSSAHRVSWAAPAVSSSPAAPPLLYSLFAEWTAPTVDAADMHAAAAAHRVAPEPTLLRHSIRMCSTQSHSHDQRTELHCDIEQDRLPRGVELTLHLLTECDYQRINAEAGSSLTHCLSTVSPELRVTLDSLLPEVSSSAALPPVSFATPGVALVANDTTVREALCVFYNQTSGPRWLHNSGWCDPTAPICNGTQSSWFGVGCDSAGEFVTSLRLGSNGLMSASPSGADISPLFTVIDRLEQLDLSNNLLSLTLADLTPLSNLRTLSLYSLSPSVSVSSVLPSVSPSLLLPGPTCRLSDIDLSSISFAVTGWAACTQLMPQLQVLFGEYSGINGDAVGSYGGGLSGGELTLFILAHLNETNPLIEVLGLTGCTALPFGLPTSMDNLPRIAAPLLTRLMLNELPLRTGPLGPADRRWLSDMPSLTELQLLSLPCVILDTSAFHYASRSLQSLICDCAVGDLLPLMSLPLLSQITLSGSNLRSQLPSNLSSAWPNLSTFACSACGLHGALPAFANLPFLTQIQLDRNALAGPIGVDLAAQSPLLTTVVLSSNLLQGPLPSFCGSPSIQEASFDNNLIESFPDLSCYGTVAELALQSNPRMRGQLPPGLWQLLPVIRTLLISNTQLNGTIPDRDSTLPGMARFLASHCQFSGPLPRNLNVLVMDLSQNDFSGPLILFDQRFGGVQPAMTLLRLVSAGNLTCPIQLSALTSLTTLIISGNNFAQCDFANITLPASVIELDLSDNQWLPFDLRISPNIASLQASRANCRGIVIDGLGSRDLSIALPNLVEITLDGSSFAPLNSHGVTVLGQIQGLLDPGTSPRLRVFSCVGCGGLPPMITDLSDPVSASSAMEVLRLDSANLRSPSLAVLGLPPNLVQFSIAGNMELEGRLPGMDSALPGLESFDASCTSLTGPIPPSWSNLPSLTQLNITNTSIQCDLVITAESRLQCAEQSVLAASPTITIEAASLADASAGVHCSALTIVATGSRSRVTADPTYHSYTQCSCDAASFGLHARCYRCPEGCTCTADTIQHCFPVVQRGSISVNPASGFSGSRFVISGSIAPFTVAAVLPCPRTVTGSSLCNPDGIAWPGFYRIVETAQADPISASLSAGSFSASLSAVIVPTSSDSELDLSLWCYPGHTGRLCAACSNGYFSSGRSCLQCLSEGVHVLILIANLLLIVALITYLYAKSPSALNAARSLQKYFHRLDGVQGDHSCHRMRSLNADGSVSAVTIASGSLSSVNGDAAAETPADTASPLKLLIFHSQQLSLLLHTSTSLPPVMAGLLSFLNSGSTGFSLSSLVALECLSSWTLSHRCWMAVVAPTIIGAIAGVTALISRKSGSSSRASRAMQLQGRDEPLLVAADHASEADGRPPSSSVVPRVYSVCVSLLYFLFFPCAQTVLSAVACTDTREVGQSYLNLSPDQGCDDQWRRAVLPPAVLGLLFWVVAFPLGSTLLLLRLRSKLSASIVSESSGPASAALRSVWPVCAEIVLPYLPRFWYWEQLLLLRRLMLVTAVTLIPASSLYLPLVLFAIIQLSALQQHWAQPYAHSLLNAGELASLYLLLINYISAIILQTGLIDGGFQQTADGWAAALFVVNLAFLLILLAGLFGWARSRLLARWPRVSGRFA